MNFYPFCINIKSFLLVIPEIFLLFGSILILLFAIFYNSLEYNKFFLNILKAVTFLMISLVVIVICLYANLINYNFILFNYTFYSSSFIVFFKIFLLALFLFILLFSYFYLKQKNIYAFEFIYLVFISFISLIFLLSANSFTSFYLLIELYNLAIYAVIGLRKNSNFSLDSALKYFIFGSISSLFLLISIVLLYNITGCFNFMDLELFLATTLSNEYLLIFSIFIFYIALLLKIAIAPFHFWIVDIYDGAPLSITFYISLIPKFVYMFIFINFFFNTFAHFSYLLYWFILFCVICAAFFGVFGAIYQTKLKRIVIYSSVFNLVFFFIPFLIDNYFSLPFFFYFLVIYCINMVGLFFILLNLVDWSRNLFFKNLANLVNLYTVNPILAWSLAIIFLSLAGLPPFSGFFPKFYLLLNLIIFDYFWLFCFLLIFSSIAIFYYIRISKIIFFIQSKKYHFFKPVPLFHSLIIAFVCIFNIFFLFFSNYLLLICHETAILFY